VYDSQYHLTEDQHMVCRACIRRYVMLLSALEAVGRWEQEARERIARWRPWPGNDPGPDWRQHLSKEHMR
jgi:hypothetical protein